MQLTRFRTNSPFRPVDGSNGPFAAGGWFGPLGPAGSDPAPTPLRPPRHTPSIRLRYPLRRTSNPPRYPCIGSASRPVHEPGSRRRLSSPQPRRESVSAVEAWPPLFPDGLTVLEGYGQWRDGTAVKSEGTIILVIWHTPAFGDETKIESVRSAYKKRFQPQSVMRVDCASCVSF